MNLEFSYLPSRGSEEYYGYKGKIVNGCLIIREYNYDISDGWGMFDKGGFGGAPITYDDSIIIIDNDNLDITIKNSGSGSITGYGTNYEKINEKCNIIDQLYENPNELISDLKNSLDTDQLKEKYHVDLIENNNVKSK